MRIAVLTRSDEPYSFRNYRESLLGRLGGRVAVTPFGLADPVPGGCDMVWDPGLGMAKIPRASMRAADGGRSGPLVATVHGVRAFSLPASELARGSRERIQLAVSKLRRRREWRRFGPRVARIIGVSEYGADEVVRAFGLPRDKVRAIHHGVDHDVFTPEGACERRDRPYLLHVSSYQRKKNIERLLAAYASLHGEGRPDLVLVSPGAPSVLGERAGVTLIASGLAPEALSAWYRGAMAFLFPSLHETFGMPILEAMACGCPVLTSTTTACPEAAGRAALLVDPRDDAALVDALRRLVGDQSLRARLAARGLEHAARFDWQVCADRHLETFREVVGSHREH